MPIPKQIANKVLSTLDETASRVESLAKSGKIDGRVAASIVRDIDSFADRFEVAAYGASNLKARQAKVLQKDADEKFMDTFDNPNKLIEGDADETFMKDFDKDMTVQVTERDEFRVRDETPLSDGTKKQPSWARGPAGKSTRQGSARRASTEKRWAP